MAEQNKGIKISDLPQSVTFTGLWTLGYQMVDGVAVSVKVSLEEIQAAYEDVKSATADARQAVTDGEALRIDLLAAESMRAASEAARQQAENLRGEDEDVRKAAEEDRKSNESARQSQESQRSDAESARQASETTREENEQARTEAEGERISHETARETAESTREENEQARISAEEQRAASEAARGEAEAVRESNEATRLSNETARQETESTRVATEIEREANELTRKSNESTRQLQEAERQTNTTTAIANAETATNAANTAAQNAIKAKEDTEAATELANELNNHPWIIQGGVWYKWNTETDQYESTGISAKGDKGDTGTVGIMLDAEPTEDTLTYIVGDVTYNFELGMAAICQDPSADNGRGVYLFKGKTDEGKAIWWKTGSTYQHPSHTAHESGLYKITTDGLGHVSDATAVAKEDITGLGIPAQDTTYEDATTSASGLMSSSDKTKMNRLESYTTSTTVASLDVNYQTIYVTLSKNASLSASGTGSAYNGRSITAYVYTSSSVTITIPTSGDYVSMCGSSFTTTADGWVEFSLVCVNGVWHIAKLEAE